MIATVSNRGMSIIFCNMSRYYSYLNSATKILSAYNGEEPFAFFIKEYFAQHKKYGSNDRKHISSFVLLLFQAGKGINVFASRGIRFLSGLFLMFH